MDWGILENETEGVRIAGDKMLTKRQYSILSFYVENRERMFHPMNSLLCLISVYGQ